jgi:uncharacterized protein (DUF1330 family)
MVILPEPEFDCDDRYALTFLSSAVDCIVISGILPMAKFASRIRVKNHFSGDQVMPAYLISQIEVHDPVGYEQYRKLVPPSLGKYGGKFIARGGRIDVLEGDWSPRRVVICEFESIERAREWYESEEYRPAMEIRQKTATAKIIVVDGL